MKIIKRILILIFILFIIFLFIKVIKVQNILLKNIYPIQYEEYVNSYANEYDVDKLLVYAIIKAESNFNKNALSSSGAKGLMQIMDATAEEISAELGINEEYNLYDEKTNIMFGTKYFSNLNKQYNNYNLALAAYNAGSGNVKKWIDKGIINEDGSNIENIPFKETNMYIRKIMQNYTMYKELYS